MNILGTNAVSRGSSWETFRRVPRYSHSKHPSRPGSIVLAAAIGGLVLFSGGCATDGNGTNKEAGGALAGAVIGAVIGSQIGSGTGRDLAIASGAILGALAGSRIGRNLDEQDRAAQAEATVEALGSDEENTTTWDNPDSNVSGTVEAGPIDDRQAGVQCRVLKQTVVLEDGTSMQEDLEVCREPGGDWEPVA